MKQLRNIVAPIFLLCLMLVAGLPVFAQTQEDVTPQEQKENTVDVKEIVFGHIGDSYEWHITTWGKTHITIPLPIIVYSSTTGWHTFLSSRLAENGGTYEGLSVAPEGSKYEGKLVEYNAAGEQVRPWDISITKVTFALLFNSVLLLVIVLSVAQWYRKRPQGALAPGGFIGFMEMFIMMVNDDIIKSCVGPNYRKFAPYLLTAFFFIFINNIMGLIPFFPGGANVTGNIAITMVLAICTFLAVNIFGTKHYWKDIFLAGCALVAESACTDDAFHRVLRNLYETVCLDDPSFRQYAGGTHGDAGTDLPDLYLGKHGTCAQRYTDGSFRTVQHFYECA